MKYIIKLLDFKVNIILKQNKTDTAGAYHDRGIKLGQIAQSMTSRTFEFLAFAFYFTAAAAYNYLITITGSANCFLLEYTSHTIPTLCIYRFT